MIKQSFLRNYCLAKIYNEVQDKKKKMNVFYVKQVQRLQQIKQQKVKDPRKENTSPSFMERKQKENRQGKGQSTFSYKKNVFFQRKPGNCIAQQKYSSNIKKDNMDSKKQKPFLRIKHLQFQGNQFFNEGDEFSPMKIHNSLSNLALKKKTYVIKRLDKHIIIKNQNTGFSAHHKDSIHGFKAASLQPLKINDEHTMEISTPDQENQPKNDGSITKKPLSYIQKVRLRKLRFLQTKQTHDMCEKDQKQSDNLSASVEQFGQI